MKDMLVRFPEGFIPVSERFSATVNGEKVMVGTVPFYDYKEDVSIPLHYLQIVSDQENTFTVTCDEPISECSISIGKKI